MWCRLKIELCKRDNLGKIFSTRTKTSTYVGININHDRARTFKNVKDWTKKWDDSNGHLRGVLSQQGQGLTCHIIFQKCILCM